ncbi:MAG: hypothetical protein GYA24_24415 [Candidatus Lokiarchaeota archaeon]|nr:hypothetical protein [Candidatus Lokiarchaeota archaeon]
MRFDIFGMALEDDSVWGMLEREAKVWEGIIPTHIVGYGGPWANSLAFSADGTLLANGAFGRVGIVDVRNWKHLRDVRWNGSTGFDKTADHYDEYVERYMDHWMRTVRFSPDGHIIYASENKIHGTTYAWNVATGELFWRRADTSFHAISPDGKYIACSYTCLKKEPSRHHDDMSESVLVLDAATGERVVEVSLKSTRRAYGNDRGFFSNKFQPSAMTFSPDGRWLVCGMAHPGWGVDPLVLIDVRNWSHATVQNIPGLDKMMIERGDQLPWGSIMGNYDYPLYEKAQSVSFSHDGRWVLRVDCIGARIWQAGDAPGDWHGGDHVGVYALPGVDELDNVYSSSAVFLGTTSLIAISHLGLGNVIEVVAGSMNGEITGSKGVYGTLGRRIAVFRCNSGMDSATASVDGRWLAIGDRGTVKIHDLDRIISRC